MPPTENSGGRLIFDFELTADLSDTVPNFLGPFSQGPKSARFVYINSGTAAGQIDSCWSRRAKVPLMEITTGEVKSVLKKPGSRIERGSMALAETAGRSRASVKGIKWMAAE